MGATPPGDLLLNDGVVITFFKNNTIGGREIP